MTDGVTIGRLAERCGVTRDTVRFYEREGLLPCPRRTSSQYRIYGAADEQRLRFIRQAQHLGFTLEDIRELLRQHEIRTPDECRRVAQRLRQRIAAIDRKIAELTAFRRRLASNLDRCQRVRASTCPVVLDLVADWATKKKET
jgi:MerR family copper efflux transcriptional regulator